MKMDARSKQSNLANLKGLEILCPKGVHSCKHLVRIYFLANVKAKRSLEGCQLATIANTGEGGGVT